jgi:hypothetical protein
MVDVYRAAGLTVAAQRMAIPGATLYRITVEERHRLAAVFLVPGNSRRSKGGQWRASRSGKTLWVFVPGGRLVVRRVTGTRLGFVARFAPGRTRHRNAVHCFASKLASQ